MKYIQGHLQSQPKIRCKRILIYSSNKSPEKAVLNKFTSQIIRWCNKFKTNSLQLEAMVLFCQGQCCCHSTDCNILTKFSFAEQSQPLKSISVCSCQQMLSHKCECPFWIQTSQLLHVWEGIPVYEMEQRLRYPFKEKKEQVMLMQNYLYPCALMKSIKPRSKPWRFWAKGFSTQTLTSCFNPIYPHCSMLDKIINNIKY